MYFNGCVLDLECFKYSIFMILQNYFQDTCPAKIRGCPELKYLALYKWKNMVDLVLQ